MDQSTGVKVVKVFQVAPPPSSSDFSLPLTFHDIYWLRFPPSQCLFFYEHPGTFYETTLPGLKDSLSIVLGRYLPLAGNLIWEPNSDKPIIHFSHGDGVSLTIAESEADFHYLSSNSFRKSKELSPLVPDLPSTDTKVAVITLQLTLFPNIGFSIGISSHHAVVDGKTITMFIHSWASICRGGDCDLIPYYDRSIVEDPEEERMYLNKWLEDNGPGNKSLKYMDVKPGSDIMLGTFHLSFESVHNLKTYVSAMLGDEDNMRVSTFTVVSALVWVCLVKTQKIEPQTVILAMPADVRDRKVLNPRVPLNYFGNCVIICSTEEAESKKLIQEDGVAIAAKAISDALKYLDDEKPDSKNISLPKGGCYSIMGSPRFELYKVDYGWGKPKKVDMISISRNEAISLSDAGDGVSAIEIGVAIKESETKTFATLLTSYLAIL